MSQFKTLYAFELRKIWKRKIVWITMGILMAVTVFMGFAEVFSTYTVSDGQGMIEISGFAYRDREKKNAETIVGRSINDALLDRVKDAYRGVYTGEYDTERYGQTSAAMLMTGEIGDGESGEDMKQRILAQEQYREIYKYVYHITGNYDAIHEISEEALYQERTDYQEKEMMWQGLSEGEKDYWREKEQAIGKPFVYGYAKGWYKVLEEFLTLNFELVLAVAVCLSTVFSEEHVRRTDQLILCSQNGRNALLLAKISAGVTFGMISAVVLFLLALISTIAFFGPEGFDTALQIIIPMSSWNLTVGQTVLLLGAVYLVAAVLYSIIAMFLSEAMKNSVAVMGLMVGCLIATMIFSVPERFRVLSQLYDLIPTVLAGVWNLTDYRLVKLCGTYLTNYQTALLLYAAISAVLVFWIRHLYRSYQVSGR